MTSDEVEEYTNHTPSYVKLLIVLQSLVIAYFVFWTFEEYANNLYFQTYVNTFLSGSGFGIIAASTVGIFSAVAGGLYMKLRQTRMQLHSLAGTEHETERHEPASGSVLAPHVEEHLINLIRKSSTDESGMPVLKREQPSGQAR